jgi:hypothetical protein
MKPMISASAALGLGYDSLEEMEESDVDMLCGKETKWFELLVLSFDI